MSRAVRQVNEITYYGHRLAKGALQDYIDAQLTLLHTADGADYTVAMSTGNVWRVRKSILTDRSDYFKKSLNSTFKEGLSGVTEFQERTAEQDASDAFSSDDIEQVIRFCYTLSYGFDHDAANQLQSHARMLELGDFFGIPLLKSVVWKHLIQSVTGAFRIGEDYEVLMPGCGDEEAGPWFARIGHFYQEVGDEIDPNFDEALYQACLKNFLVLNRITQFREALAEPLSHIAAKILLALTESEMDRDWETGECSKCSKTMGEGPEAEAKLEQHKKFAVHITCQACSAASEHGIEQL